MGTPAVKEEDLIRVHLATAEEVIASHKAMVELVSQGRIVPSIALIDDKGDVSLLVENDSEEIREKIDECASRGVLLVIEAIMVEEDLGDMWRRWEGRLAEHPQAKRFVYVVAEHADMTPIVHRAPLARDDDTVGAFEVSSLETLTPDYQDGLLAQPHPWRNGAPYAAWHLIVIDRVDHAYHAFAARPHKKDCVVNHGTGRWWLLHPRDRGGAHYLRLLSIGYEERPTETFLRYPTAEALLPSLSKIGLGTFISLVYLGSATEPTQDENDLQPPVPSAIAIGPVPRAAAAPPAQMTDVVVI